MTPLWPEYLSLGCLSAPIIASAPTIRITKLFRYAGGIRNFAPRPTKRVFHIRLFGSFIDNQRAACGAVSESSKLSHNHAAFVEIDHDFIATCRWGVTKNQVVADLIPANAAHPL